MIQVPGYRIARKIAAGSSGTVYLATQENLERRVAIKVLAPGLFDAWETRVRFLREAKVQASLAHPALVRVIDAGFSEDLPWLAMELVEGGSLRSLLSRCGRLEVAKAVEIGASIAGGLAHAHRKDIVHRDLKPENVLMTEDGRAKVTDFGLARVLKGGETLRTATGVILGTPGYIAPEVLLGHPVRTAADVYALGVILFELIAGAKPFEAEGIAELLKLQVTGQVPSLAAREPSVSPELDAFVSQCLARAPDERPSAAAVEASLRAQDSGPRFAAGSAAASGRSPGPVARTVSFGPAAVASLPQATMHVEPIPRELARGRLGTLAATVVLLVAAGGGWLMTHRVTARQEPSKPEMPAPAASSSAPAGKLPEIERITVSDHSAIVRLAPGTAAETHVRYGMPERREVDAGRVGPGTQEIPLGDLPANGAHCWVDLELAGKHVRQPFDTMRTNRQSYRCLNPDGPGVSGVRTVDAGGSIAAIWQTALKPTHDKVQFSESFDAGQTWTDATDLQTDDRQVRWPFLTRVPGGLVAAWCAWEDVWTAWTVIRYRPDKTRRWGPAIRELSALHAPALAVGPGGEVLVLSWLPEKRGDGARLRIARFDLAAARLSFAPGLVPWPHEHGGCRCVEAATFGARLYCIGVGTAGWSEMAQLLTNASRNYSLGTGRGIFWISSATPLSGGWSPVRPLTSTQESVQAGPRVVAFKKGLAVCYESAMTVRVRMLGTENGPSREWCGPVGEGMLARLGSMALDGERLVVACMTDEAGPTKVLPTDSQINMPASLDGANWSRGPATRGPTFNPRQLELSFWQGRPVLLAVDDRANAVVLKP